MTDDLLAYLTDTSTSTVQALGSSTSSPTTTDLSGYGSPTTDLSGYGSSTTTDLSGYGSSTTTDLSGYGSPTSDSSTTNLTADGSSTTDRPATDLSGHGRSMTGQGQTSGYDTVSLTASGSDLAVFTSGYGPVVNSPTVGYSDVVTSESGHDGATTTTTSHGLDDDGPFYWTDQLRRALNMPVSNSDEALAAATQLEEIMRNFREAAVTYGRVIISEYHLPAALKTVRPADVGGIAGGEKYLINSIMFKFAFDLPLANSAATPTHMYGGSGGAAHQLAIKAAGSEFRNLSHLSLLVFERRLSLELPLMAIVDFAGFRLIAMSLLPVALSQLAYGSADGGATFNDTSAPLRRLVTEACEQLNLKRHRVGSGETAGPGDLEGHVFGVSSHERYFLLDFGRLMPPEAVATPPRPRLGRQIFYRFLRPELVVAHPQPLCSDAFSGWIVSDPLMREHNADVQRATDALHQRSVPAAARDLDDLFAASTPVDGNQLCLLIHRHGVNLRHLGRLFDLCHCSGARLALLTEACARALKNLLNAQLRALVARSESQRLNALLSFCAQIVNQDLQPPTIESTSSTSTIESTSSTSTKESTKESTNRIPFNRSEQLWLAVRSDLYSFFNFASTSDDSFAVSGCYPYTGDESLVGFFGDYVSQLVDMRALLERFFTLVGLTPRQLYLDSLEPVAQVHSMQLTRQVPLLRPLRYATPTLADVLHWQPVVKHSALASLSAARSAYIRTSAAPQLPMLQLASEYAADALQRVPTSRQAQLQCGLVAFERARVLLWPSNRAAAGADAEQLSRRCFADAVRLLRGAIGDGEPLMFLSASDAAMAFYLLGSAVCFVDEYAASVEHYRSAAKHDAAWTTAQLLADVRALFAFASLDYRALNSMLCRLWALHPQQPAVLGYLAKCLHTAWHKDPQRFRWLQQLPDAPADSFVDAFRALLQLAVKHDVVQVRCDGVFYQSVQLFTLPVLLCHWRHVPALAELLPALLAERLRGAPFSCRELVSLSEVTHTEQGQGLVELLQQHADVAPAVVHCDLSRACFLPALWDTLAERRCITSLTISCSISDELLNSLLVACPQLRSLKLVDRDGIGCAQPRPDSFPFALERLSLRASSVERVCLLALLRGSAASLQRLTLVNVSVYDGDDSVGTLSGSDLADTAAALTSLKIKLRPYQPGAWSLDGLQRLPQLRRLGVLLESFADGWSVLRQLPALVDLQLLADNVASQPAALEPREPVSLPLLERLLCYWHLSPLLSTPRLRELHCPLTIKSTLFEPAQLAAFLLRHRHVEVLQVRCVAADAALLDAVAALDGLRQLIVTDNKWSDDVAAQLPQAIASQTQLQRLEFGSGQRLALPPTCLALWADRLGQLARLKLRHCRLTDVAALARLPQLRRLAFKECNGFGLPDILRLAHANGQLQQLTIVSELAGASLLAFERDHLEELVRLLPSITRMHVTTARGCLMAGQTELAGVALKTHNLSEEKTVFELLPSRPVLPVLGPSPQ